MVNVYDHAHNLARALKDSEEFKNYMNAKEIIKENESVKAMIEDFQKKQMQIQAAQMMGQEIEEDEMAKLQELYGILLTDPTAAQYIQSEMIFTKIMSDISGILGEVLKIEE